MSETRLLPNFKAFTTESEISSCALTINNLKQLYDLLQGPTQKSIGEAVNTLDIPPREGSTEQVNQYKNYLMTNATRLTVEINGTGGEYIAAYDNSIFREDTFPLGVEEIVFTSDRLYQSVVNQIPAKKFELKLDFKKLGILNMTRLDFSEAQNQSLLTTLGDDQTWVNGIQKTVTEFLSQRSRKRRWLHQKYMYDVFLWFVTLPIALRAAYWIDQRWFAEGNFSTVLSLGVYLYVIIGVALLGRILFNYARWVYPMVEFLPPHGSRIGTFRAGLYLLILSIIATMAGNLLNFG